MARKRRTLGSSVRSRVVYGSDVAAVRSQLTPKQWKLVVKTAQRRGLTPRGVLQDVPSGAFRERSNAGIMAEARRRAGSIYNPQKKVLDQATQRAYALADKRKTDLAQFNEWLANQQSALQSGARAADAMLGERITRIQQDARDSDAAMQATAIKNVQAQGAISAPADSTALAQLAEASKRNEAKLAAQGGQLVTQSGNALGMMNIAASAMLGQRAASEVQRQADLSQQLGAVEDARLKLTADERQTIDQIGQSLKDKNYQVQEANRQFGAAADKLGLEGAKLKFQIRSTKQKLALESKKFNLSTWVARNKALAEKAKLELGYDKIAAQDGRAAADRALSRWVQRHKDANARLNGGAGPGGAKVTDAQRKASRDAMKGVQSARSQIQILYQESGGKGTVQHGPNKGKTFRQILLQRGFDTPTINLAFDIQRNRGRISPGGIRTAKNLGIIHPTSIWKPVGR